MDLGFGHCVNQGLGGIYIIISWNIEDIVDDLLHFLFSIFLASQLEGCLVWFIRITFAFVKDKPDFVRKVAHAYFKDRSKYSDAARIMANERRSIVS